MEESLKFNSQVCTDINQSKKLLELGLKPETADCYNREEEYGFSNWIGKPSLTTDIPAWSLHRLLCMLDNMHELHEKMRKEIYPLVVPELHRQHGRNASYGWNGSTCPNKHQKKFLAETYYIYRELRHQLTQMRNSGEYNVYNSPTLTCEDSGEPIIIEEL